MFSIKQQKDLETIEHFIPDAIRDVMVTDQDRADFLAFSELGRCPKIETEGYKALKEGKKWRGVHMGMYEDGVMDGTMPYYVILGGCPQDKIMPSAVVEFMKKEMFKGIDSETIKMAYQFVLREKTGLRGLWNRIRWVLIKAGIWTKRKKYFYEKYA